MKKTWISSAHQGFVEENMCPNTLSAIYLAAQKGADMIETDVRTTSDGVFVVNHDPDAVGFDEGGTAVSYEISKTDSEIITKVILAPKDPRGIQYIPTLAETLELAYFSGIQVNLDLKEGIRHADDIAKMVCEFGMRGKVVYATNGAGAACIRRILKIDPDARFIDTVSNFTAEKLADIPDYPAKCFVYTADFSDENIVKVRESGCMLAAISLNEENAVAAFRHHPDMAEYPHTSDFERIDQKILPKHMADLFDSDQMRKHNGNKKSDGMCI